MISLGRLAALTSLVRKRPQSRTDLEVPSRTEREDPCRRVDQYFCAFMTLVSFWMAAT